MVEGRETSLVKEKIMTLPDERFRALKQGKKLLEELDRIKKLPKPQPQIIKDDAESKRLLEENKKLQDEIDRIKNLPKPQPQTIIVKDEEENKKLLAEYGEITPGSAKFEEFVQRMNEVMAIEHEISVPELKIEDFDFESIYHIYSHVSGKELIFRESKNYTFFLDKNKFYIFWIYFY